MKDIRCIDYLKYQIVTFASLYVIIYQFKGQLYLIQTFLRLVLEFFIIFNLFLLIKGLVLLAPAIGVQMDWYHSFMLSISGKRFATI